MSRSHRTLARNGFTLPEVLVALAITSFLMVGLAMAFHAATQTVSVNDRTARSSQVARIAMQRLLTEARTCFEPVATSTTLNFKPENFDEKRTYAFDAANRQLTMTIHRGLPDVPDPVVVVARDVAAASFRFDGKAIGVTLTVGSGDTATTLSGSAVPRRFLTYQ